MGAGERTVAQRAEVAAAAGLPNVEQERVASDPSPRVRRAVASRPDLTAVAAGLLAGDSDRQVRQRLADNPARPAGVLIRLLADRQFQVGRTPSDVLVQLARDRSVNVRWWVGAGHPDDAGLARIGVQDPDPMNARQAQAHLAEVEWSSRHPDAEVER